MDESVALSRVISGEGLARAEMEALMGRLMDGELSDLSKAALLAALAAKGESVEEIAGAATAMRQRVVRVPHSRERAVDTCGTGGDGRGTFNISTAAALIAAAAGVPIAKHGNRSVSSRSGSADVLEELGVELAIDAAAAGRCLDEIGIAFLFAPALHPAMREVVPVRKALGVRTIFNVVGPLTNPAGARRQVMGVFSGDLVETLASVQAELGSRHALIVHGADGLDEITTTGPTRIAEVREGEISIYDLEPEELGLRRADIGELAGGDPSENASALLRTLHGEEGALRDVSLLNAAAAIYVGGVAGSVAAGLEAAREAVESGAAGAKLDELVRFTRGVAGSP